MRNGGNVTQLNEDLLAGIKTARERKLSNAERVAIYAFHQRGVPVKILAHLRCNAKRHSLYHQLRAHRRARARQANV